MVPMVPISLRRSHEILIPSVPLAGWDVAFVAQEPGDVVAMSVVEKILQWH